MVFLQRIAVVRRVEEWVVQKGVAVGFAFVEVAVQESLAVAQVVD